MLLEYIKKKYKDIPVQARASLWFMLCGVLQSGMGIITLPLFTRLLSQEQYGLSSTYFAWSDLIIVVCTLRLSYGVFDKGMVKYENKRDKFEACLLGLTTTISLVMTSFFLIFHKTVEQFLGMSFILCFSLFLNQVFAPAMLFWTARNKFELQYLKFTIVTLSFAVICTAINILSVVCLPYDRGLVKILSYQIIWGIVYAVIYTIIFCKGKSFYDKEIWTYAIKFNLPLIPYFLSTIILDKADRIMIREFCGDADVALYSVSYNIARLMVIATSSLDATLTPWLFMKLKKNRFGNSKVVTVYILLFFAAISILFMFFAPELVSLFATEDYKSAVYIIPPVITSYYFVMVYAIVSKIEFYNEKTGIISLITIIAALLDIVLNYIFIPIYGYTAAGYTTLASYVFMALGHFIISYRIAIIKGISKDIFYWRSFIIVSVIMIIITILVNYVYGIKLFRFGCMFVLLIMGVLFRKQIISVINEIRSREK